MIPLHWIQICWNQYPWASEPISYHSEIVGIVCADFLSCGNGGDLIFKDFSLQCAFSQDSSLPRSIGKMIFSTMFPFLLGFVFMLLWMLLALQKSNFRSYLFQNWVTSAYSVLYISYTALAESLLKIAMSKKRTVLSTIQTQNSQLRCPNIEWETWTSGATPTTSSW